MLGFLKPRGELVEISGRTVVFLSAKPYKMDQKFEIKLGLPEPPGQTVTVAVRVLSCRPGPGDFFVVVSIAEGRREPPTLKGYRVRNHPRARHRITVSSEGLPSYRAVTKDLSRGGFGAELDGELPEGKLLTVHFEFDEPLGWTLDLKAKVVWSVWKSQNRFDTGLEFLEDPLYALPLEQLGAWLEHREKHELIPFKPPDKLPPRRPNQLPNQLPQAHQLPEGVEAVQHGHHSVHHPQDSYPLSEAQRAAKGITSYDDDPTPLGLPTLVMPPSRPASLKLPQLPQTIALERPSAFSLKPSTPAPPVETADTTRAPAGAEQDPVEDEDVGVRIHFEATLRGWAWEGADDSVVVVLEDIHGSDNWLEFSGCRGLQARCRQREINLLGMAVATKSRLITELTRDAEEELKLLHFRFHDDHQRVVLEIVAPECREQLR